MEMKYYLLATRFRFLFNIILIFAYLIVFNLLANNSNNESDEVLSGYVFAEPSTRSIQDDDFLNPGMFWVDNGETIWNKKEGAKELSCHTCHGESSSMKGVSLKYPKVFIDNKKLINLEQRINMCRKKMEVQEFEVDSREIISLSTLIANKSRNPNSFFTLFM